MKNYYKILGVPPSAAAPDIKKAFRTLAKEFHPDTNPEKQYAHARFVEIQEAYSVLSDPSKKKRYDNEAWIEGLNFKSGGKHQAITPDWLLSIAVQLTASLQKMDAYRISHKTLQEYILLILTDAHLAVLQNDADTATNTLLVQQLLGVLKYLEYPYLGAVIDRLLLVAPVADATAGQLTYYRDIRRKEEHRRQAFPYIIILVTLLLCIMMYFYGAL